MLIMHLLLYNVWSVYFIVIAQFYYIHKASCPEIDFL